jgi:GxxExxY protein
MILDAAFEVSNELGAGFVESVYEGALWIALQERKLLVERQYPLKIQFHGKTVGNFVADLIVEGSVLLELKAVKSLLPEHQAQTLNYVKATGIPVALLINFGNPKLEYWRFDNKFTIHASVKEEMNRDAVDEGDLLPPQVEET